MNWLEVKIDLTFERLSRERSKVRRNERIKDNINGHSPVSWGQCDGSGLIQVLPEEHFAIRAIEVTDLYAIGLRVSPIQFFGEPIAGQTIRRYDPRLDYREWLVLTWAAINFQSFDHFEANVGPEYNTIFEIVVESRRFFQMAYYYRCVRSLIVAI